MGLFNFFKKKDNRDDSFDYTPEEKKLLNEGKKHIGVTPFLLGTTIKQEKDYKQEDIKKKCNIEFNDGVPDSIREKFLLYFERKGIYDLKGWNELVKKEGKSKIGSELVDTVKDDPEYVKWSVETFFKDSLELCIRKSDGTLKNWIIDEAIKQSILDECI